MIVIDYLQLMEPMNKFASPVQQVTENSRALKMLAKELNVPVLVFHSFLGRRSPRAANPKLG